MAPTGALMSIVPVGTAQVGCTVVDAVGTAGKPGTAFTVTLDEAADIQVLSTLLRAVKVWLPGATKLKLVEA